MNLRHWQLLLVILYSHHYTVNALQLFSLAWSQSGAPLSIDLEWVLYIFILMD